MFFLFFKENTSSLQGALGAGLLARKEPRPGLEVAGVVPQLRGHPQRDLRATLRLQHGPIDASSCLSFI